MARIIQYPHYLFVTEATEAYQDEDGNWVGGGTQLVLKTKCREETNGKGLLVQVAGGEFKLFSSLIQCPEGTSRIQEGTEIVVSDDESGNEVRIKGEVLKCDKGQLHTRLWV